MVKKILYGALGAGLLLATNVPSAFAFNCSNLTTGPRSKNICDKLEKKRMNVKLHNNATVEQEIEAEAETGENKNNGNTLGGGAIITNPAVVSTNLPTDVNSLGASSITQTDPADPVVGLNSITGPYSTNEVFYTAMKKLKVDIHNKANVDQDVKAEAETGENESNGNTVGGNITSGSATVGTTITTFVNFTELVINQ